MDLCSQLTALSRALTIARRESDPKRRENWLAAINRGIDAAVQEHRDAAGEGSLEEAV